MKVALTRAAGGNDALAELLGDLEPVECPLIEVEPIGGPPISLAGYDWVVLTSRHGVDALFARLEGRLPRVAAIGPGTAGGASYARRRAGSRPRGLDPGGARRRVPRRNPAGCSSPEPRPPGTC